MVILNYISVNAVATPVSKDTKTLSSSSIPPNPTQTKITISPKIPQSLSTGVVASSGETTVVPVTTTTKLRKYWGGEGEDPVTSDEYIWNKDFMDRMKKYVQDPVLSSAKSVPVKEKPFGFLSINRVMSLDSLEVDLSKELKAPSKVVLQQKVEPAVQIENATPKWRLAPTRREQEKWDRATKAATGGSDVLLREVKKPRGDPKVLAAQSRKQYTELKNKLQILTLGIGGFGLVSAYVSYSPEIAASFGAGFLGSLVYIRMLGTSIDSMSEGARGLIKGAIGQPRLLVPVALVMIYNRWNGILVPEYGFMSLELIPMLVGFFTFKIATLVQAIEEAITIVENKQDPNLN